MKVSECMTQDVELVTPEQPIREAAQFMLRADAGALPVGDGDRLIGMVTDRDITVRGVAEGLGPDTPVRQVMTEDLVYCYDDDEIENAAMKMSDAQVRRLPVLSREGDRLVGILSLGDISRSDRAEEATQVALDGITEPGGEHNQSNEG
jgi:CBS domain-containing protein